MATEQVTDTIDSTHGRMTQRIRRLTTNQNFGVGNPLWSTFCLTQGNFLEMKSIQGITLGN